LPRRLNFSHRRVFMVGEELAREGIGTLLDPVARVPQNRMTAFLSVARGRAVDVLNADAPIEQFPAEMVRELTQAVMRRPTTLTTFIGQILETGVDPIAAVFETYHTAAGSDSLSYQGIRLAGMGLFRDANLVGILEGPQAQGLLLAMGLASDPSIAVPAPWGDFIIVVRLHETTAQLVPLLHGDRVSARVRIQAKFSLQENTSPTPIHSRGISGRLKPALEGQVRQMAEAAIKEAQAAGADPLGIGHAIHSADPAYWRRIQPSWERLYAKMKVQVEVALQLEHTGGIIQPVTGKGGHR
ncbi:MAG TPA: Ger(x)C family spore germination C-terminal domain-containing protein, partial [Symbiobacteriaceae bacterium]|nr:Ger(x)C family spore germination C-terminal domain-containing protein [Symbiobacteriaceae bacterium]